MVKRSRDDTFKNDSSDEFQFGSDNTEDDDIALSSGSEILATMNALRRFNVCSDSSSDEEMNIQKSDSSSDNEWTNVTNRDIVPQEIQISSGTRTPGSQLNSTHTDSFFTDELIRKIVEETNRYANHMVTPKEMPAFLGIILLMETMPLSSLKDYWTSDEKCRIPYFAEIFRRDRFLQVFWMLHTNENIVDANIGYIQTSLPYYGSFTTEKLVEPDLPISTRIVLQLYHNLLQSNSGAVGYHIFNDQYFTSIPLADTENEM
ncbi:unnamed protein product [Xylocopa violacea]|uniref:PiggyBac transposable element-derived protein domain-containing protein n=1 Tax=Xylocopa violacea TaxID=135666 RepID=A0ABP1N8T1_XYLVO